MKEYVEYIVKNLVGHPDKVETETKENGNDFLVEVHVDPSDVGKVIGRNGATIKAIRTIVMMTSCARLGRKVRVEVVE